MALTALALLLLACSPPGTDAGDDDDDDNAVEPACPYDTSSWYDSVDVLQAFAGTDGVVEYDPPDPLLKWREGTYDSQSGEFECQTDYIDGYKHVTHVMAGTVNVEADGDFEADYQYTRTDVLGVEQSVAVSFTQAGCQGEVELTNLGDPGGYPATYTFFNETVSDDEIVKDLETTYNDEPYLARHVARADFTEEYTIDWRDGGYLATGTYFADGRHSREATSLSDDTYSLITSDYEADGSYHYYYERYFYEDDELEAIFDVYYNYDGSGEGTYTIWVAGEKIVCDYERDPLADEDCTYTVTCDDGVTSVYDC